MDLAAVTSDNSSNISNASTEDVLTEFDMHIRMIQKSRIYYFTLDVILFLPTILGNSCILIALIRYASLRACKSHIMIGNLAVSDLLVGVVLMPLDIFTRWDKSWLTDYNFCLWQNCGIFTLIGASVMNLFLLSLERFHAIMFPLQHQSRITRRRLYCCITITWLIIVLFSFLPMFGLRKDFDPDNFVCRTSSVFTDGHSSIFGLLIVVTMIFNFIFFIIIVRIAINKLRNFSKLSALSGSYHTMKHDVRHTCIMLMISGLFIIFWGPFCIIAMLPDTPNVVFARTLCASLGYINSCLNWIVYGIRSKKYRQALLSMINCRCRHKDYQLNSSTS